MTEATDEVIALIPNYRALWQAMMSIASERLTMLRDFADNYPANKADKDYEEQRTWCVFHLQWIFDEHCSRFSFRTLFEFSDHPDLNDVDAMRQRILSWLNAEVQTELARPVDPVKMAQLAVRWGSTQMPAKYSTARPAIATKKVREDIETHEPRPSAHSALWLSVYGNEDDE